MVPALPHWPPTPGLSTLLQPWQVLVHSSWYSPLPWIFFIWKAWQCFRHLIGAAAAWAVSQQCAAGCRTLGACLQAQPASTAFVRVLRSPGQVWWLKGGDGRGWAGRVICCHPVCLLDTAVCQGMHCLREVRSPCSTAGGALPLRHRAAADSSFDRQWRELSCAMTHPCSHSPPALPSAPTPVASAQH